MDDLFNNLDKYMKEIQEEKAQQDDSVDQLPQMNDQDSLYNKDKKTLIINLFKKISSWFLFSKYKRRKRIL